MIDYKEKTFTSLSLWLIEETKKCKHLKEIELSMTIPQLAFFRMDSSHQ